LDYSNAPGILAGPFNTPFPMTVSASRVAVSMLAGAGEASNKGHFRPIEVVTRPDSMFHPLSPAPCNLGHFGGIQAIEVIYQAISQALPNGVPACSGGDLCPIVWWGTRQATGDPWADGSPHPVGQGAHQRSDGANSLMHVSQAATRFSPAEVWETRNPWLVEKIELAADSGGPGRHRGGLGVDMFFRMLEDTYVTSVVERSKNPLGAWKAEARADPTARRSAIPTEHARSSARPRVSWRRRGPRSSCARAVGTDPPPSAIRIKWRTTSPRVR
jgi:N-methylhydantoinase B